MKLKEKMSKYERLLISHILNTNINSRCFTRSCSRYFSSTSMSIWNTLYYKHLKLKATVNDDLTHGKLEAYIGDSKVDLKDNNIKHIYKEIENEIKKINSK